MADFAVVVGHDVVGVGVDADQADDLNRDAGFLAGVADDSVGDVAALDEE